MKFSELDEVQWADLQPYLDTCLLPVTGLTGSETPPEATGKVAAAGDWLYPLETAFRGRTVTQPAYHYADAANDEEIARLERYCASLRQTGYRFLIVVTGSESLAAAKLSSVDLVIGPGAQGSEPEADTIRRAVTEMWRQKA
ncbi:DUF2487 domain-containing protein [Cohnella lubricantis]|uniref:DUF2487 family protein n=1 Tax=Cohnella lubricantis TaxID=2163172 RepID=A0A841THH3_9BACL|nr:DUF2487 family protein [Cohnella lubricantis]MBB6679595.1 DUF2487 family protein [Cohnella lubricantis]MBP2119937.1 hypothetical protein [Cohnella lubricantis]